MAAIAAAISRTPALAAIFILACLHFRGASAAALVRRAVEERAEVAPSASADANHSGSAGDGTAVRRIFCAEQWKQCHCPGGRVRWGSGDKWIDAEPDSRGFVTCSIWKLPDIAPGDDGKHCECIIPATSREFLESVNPGTFLDQGPAGPAPDVSCARIAADVKATRGDGSPRPWVEQLHHATASLCDAEQPSAQLPRPARGAPPLEGDVLISLMDAWLHPQFRENHKRLVDEDGWMDEAFVNYVGGATPGNLYANMTTLLVDSVHKFSAKPVIVVNFGMYTPPEWTAEKYPRLVLFHARPMPSSAHRSFNWNKLRAMLMAKVRTGIELDSDMFVAPGVDRMFESTRREVTKDYPMPILPAHFLDWAPKDGGTDPPRYWSGVCEGDKYERCPGQTQRWGHAHPTWTFWALPFLGRWVGRQFTAAPITVSAKLTPPGEGAISLLASEVGEDEDLLNLATWLEGGTKQWCKFDVEDPTEFDSFLRRDPHGGDVIRDDRFYPNGVAHAYYTAHHAVKPDQTQKYLELLTEHLEKGVLPLPIRYKGGYYANDREVREAHPELRCLI
eukprot:TRINITY_DN37566_c0_g1_i1.p1 TRINITY_DN37566_c0_g1~~TRINITY_DN37566_c0_g1_i1.p1  ORF type:complete len:562 (-),score=112.12 TRINITY_DN37566_c0_g1_i1:110-1795(-)